jgi:hypothetical protein
MKLRLVDDWRRSLRWASMQLAIIVSALVAYICATPSILFSVIAFIPRGDLQWPFAIGAGLLVFTLVAATRLLKKAPKEERDGDQT